MNYRHAFHAGNFADVLKHTVLVRVLTYLQRKQAPLRVIDTHAGAGCYDLLGEAAQRTTEWHGGIKKVFDAQFTPDIAALLAPYVNAVASINPPGELRYYPGSPRLAAALLREQDRMVVNEKHAEDVRPLHELFARNRNVKVLSHDGWTVLKSVLPPKERRGLTLVDPPFEQPGDFDRLVQCVHDHHKRFATGTLLLWYPIKVAKPVDRFYRQLREMNLKSCLRATLRVDQRSANGPIKETGVIIINPPYVLHDELAGILPALCTTLKQSSSAGYDLEWFSNE